MLLPDGRDRRHQRRECRPPARTSGARALALLALLALRERGEREGDGGVDGAGGDGRALKDLEEVGALEQLLAQRVDAAEQRARQHATHRVLGLGLLLLLLLAIAAIAAIAMAAGRGRPRRRRPPAAAAARGEQLAERAEPLVDGGGLLDRARELDAHLG